jgi:hypothetical protein
VKEARNWRRADWDKIRQDLQRVRWKTTFQGKTAAEKWSLMKSNVLKAVKKHVPVKKFSGADAQPG